MRSPIGESMAKLSDPVCKTEIFSPIFRSEYMGKEYLFCSMSCKRRFDRDPAKYAR